MTSSDQPSDQSQQDIQRKRPKFWVGPLVAGCCFSLGFGITQRALTVQSNAETPSPESFAAVAFPGESLRSLRDLHGRQAGGIQVDVAAIEAEQEAERKAKEEAERRAEEAKRAEQELQAVIVPRPVIPQPQWTQPSLPDVEANLEPVVEPAMEPELEPAAEPTPQAPEPLLESTLPPEIQPAAAVDTPPEVAAPADFFVPVNPPPIEP